MTNLENITNIVETIITLRASLQDLFAHGLLNNSQTFLAAPDEDKLATVKMLAALAANSDAWNFSSKGFLQIIASYDKDLIKRAHAELTLEESTQNN
jgi:hypothetical protein